MNVLIVEDEPLAAQRIEKLIRQILPEAKTHSSIDSVKLAVNWLRENPAPDLILMDIQLADGISFQVFEQVEVKAAVIFITAYDAYALKAFKVNSIDYLLKPIDETELRQAIEKYKRLAHNSVNPKLMESIEMAMQTLTQKYKERFVIKVGEHLKTISTDEILFFFSQEKTTFAQTADGRKYVLDFSLDYLEKNLSLNIFFRVNRKYIIRISSIQDMISYTNSRLKLKIKTSVDSNIIVARERVELFKNWLGQ
ncbi:MAG: response regulator transcription factor [Bacteroidetes bacterium]|nr:response regulator transcription factor [Bacteroidota bacterium]